MDGHISGTCVCYLTHTFISVLWLNSVRLIMRVNSELQVLTSNVMVSIEEKFGSEIDTKYSRH